MLQVRTKTDADEALRTVEGVLDRVADLPEFWDSLAHWWGRRTAAAFTRMDPLARSTVARKGFNTPLVDTGGLLEAVLSGAPATRSRLEASFGIPKGSRLRPLAVLHRNGTTRMPARNPVPGLSADDVREVRERLRDFILKAVR